MLPIIRAVTSLKLRQLFGLLLNHKILIAALVVVCLWRPLPAAELGLATAVGMNDFVLAANGKSVPVIMATTDAAVRRAAIDLTTDIQSVCGALPALLDSAAGAESKCLIIGTLGHSPLIDQLAADGKLATNGIAGQWESYVLQVVDHPLPGIDRALVIAGSDRRGTIYGIYQLSEMIGVSPWHWWADVPVVQQGTLALQGDLLRQEAPAVKYRGIFLNDEDWGLRPWSARTLEPETGAIGPKTYARIFELLLRLRANHLWPAMHPGTRAFNDFSTNKELAEAYGIVMGSSHCEQMLRDNVGEWDEKKFGDYNFVTNPDGVLKYWEQRARDNGRFENIYTLGMRGVHDGAMPGGGTDSEKAVRLHRIMAAQRDILARQVNTNLAQVPQIFCVYKEVLPLYRLAPNIPDDITLVWPDDNYGYIRQFSSAREQQRSGGAGVYYHISYWGTPYDYLWLNSTPPALMAEEMVKAFDYGASKVWMLNVGDLKPGEVGLEYFLKLAWNPHVWQGTNTDDLLLQQFARDFNPAIAPEMVTILNEYYRLGFQRKPEHMGFPGMKSQLGQPVFAPNVNGDETEQRLDSWRNLVPRVEAVAAALPSSAQDACYQLLGYPVLAAAAMNEKSLALTRYYTYTAQGRAQAGTQLEIARQAQTTIQRLTDRYNRQVAGGKWNYMMSSHPRDLEVFNLPKIPPPEVPVSPARLGLAIEGMAQSVFAAPTNAPLALPPFNVLLPQTHFVDVFNGGSGTQTWSAAASTDWIQLSTAAGQGDARVQVSIDWSRAPKGEAVAGEITFAAAGQNIVVGVQAFNPEDPGAITAGVDFIEANRCVVMQASHASAWLPGSDAAWGKISGLGYLGTAVTVFPATTAVRNSAPQILGESPCLQYNLWLQHEGDWQVTVRALPTFSVVAGQPQRYAIAFDDQTPQVVSLPVGKSENDPAWQKNVLRNAALTISNHSIGVPGKHTLKIWMVDPGIVLDTIVAVNGSGKELGYLWPAETALPASH